MKHIKTISLLLCCLLVLPSVGFCSATYQITAEQLTTLEQNLNRLESINKILLQDSSQSSKDLIVALSELKLLQSELKQLRTESQMAQNSLKQANESLNQASQSLKQLEQQEKKLKRNNVFLQILTGIAITYAAIK